VKEFGEIINILILCKCPNYVGTALLLIILLDKFSENQNEFRKILVCEKVRNELISKRTKK
jgi:hypothetical protein